MLFTNDYPAFDPFVSCKRLSSGPRKTLSESELIGNEGTMQNSWGRVSRRVLAGIPPPEVNIPKRCSGVIWVHVPGEITGCELFGFEFIVFAQRSG